MRQKIRLVAALCGLLFIIPIILKLDSPQHRRLLTSKKTHQVLAASVSPPVVYVPHSAPVEVSRSAPLVVPTTTTIAPTTTTTVLKHLIVTAASSNTPVSGCIGHTMSWSQAHACWDGLIDQYPWNHTEAFKILYCESRGKTNAANGKYIGLMQETYGSTDPIVNIRTAYNEYYLPRGWEPWSCR